MALPADFDLDDFVRRVLAEDLGAGGDVTSSATIAADARFTAEMNARAADRASPGSRSPRPSSARSTRRSRSSSWRATATAVEPGATLMRLDGNARAMLAAERSALNTLQHLSGIATLTRRYVDAIAGTGAVLLDTRKTIPGLRVLEKYAARMGGAQNHRMRLDDGVLIKDNHVAVCGGVAEAVRRAKAANTGLQVQVEVDRVDQIEPALAAGADRLLLDNMPPHGAARGGRAGRRPRAARSVGRGRRSKPSAPSPRPASISSRSGGSPSRRRPSTSGSIIRSSR